MANAWQLHGKCMATAWQLHGDCMTTAWQMHGNPHLHPHPLQVPRLPAHVYTCGDAHAHTHMHTNTNRYIGKRMHAWIGCRVFMACVCIYVRMYVHSLMHAYMLYVYVRKLYTHAATHTHTHEHEKIHWYTTKSRSDTLREQCSFERLRSQTCFNDTGFKASDPCRPPFCTTKQNARHSLMTLVLRHQI